MAQVVGYYDNYVEYREGPFVIVNAHGWRIEVEHKRARCPVLPDLSIYPLEKQFGLDGKTDDRELAARVCDSLNQMVRAGQIKLMPEGFYKYVTSFVGGVADEGC